MRVRKSFLMALSVSLLVGCTSGHPVPPEAFKACIDKGWKPVYKSTTSGTHFECVPLGKPRTDALS